MNNKEYENKYNGTVKRLRFIGWITLILGGGCVIAAEIDFFSCMQFWREPKLFFLNFIGFPLLFVGIVCLTMGYKRKIEDFTVSQSAPVAKDFTNYMVDGTSDSVANMAGKVANAVNQNNSGKVEGVDVNTCSKCGTANSIGAKFCSNCGNALTKKCPYCGAENDDGAKFCNECGKELY